MAFKPMRRKTAQFNFTRVKNTEFEKEGAVEDFLDTQFTVNYEDGTFGFLFYKDKGVTWEPLDESAKKKPPANFDEFVKYIADSQPAGPGVWDSIPKSTIVFDKLSPAPTFAEPTEQQINEMLDFMDKADGVL